MTEVLDRPVTRDEALKQLRMLEREIRALGITSLYLFGSTARDQAGPASDIDLCGDLDPSRDFGFSFFGLAGRIGDLVGRKVDFIERDAIHPRMKADVETQGVRVY